MSLLPSSLIPLFSPARLHRPRQGLVAGKITGRSLNGRYDILLSDGLTVARSLRTDEFSVTGEPERPTHIIPFEGSPIAGDAEWHAAQSRRRP